MAAQEEAGADRELAALGYDSMFDEPTEPKEPPDDDTEITE